MMRMTQFIGLNTFALDLINKNKVLVHTDRIVRVYPNGETKELPDRQHKEIPSKPSGETWCGMYDEEGNLSSYTLLDGSIVTEFEQASPWSSGPVIFLALQDEKGVPIRETLWTEEEIESYC